MLYVIYNINIIGVGGSRKSLIMFFSVSVNWITQYHEIKNISWNRIQKIKYVKRNSVTKNKVYNKLSHKIVKILNK